MKQIKWLGVSLLVAVLLSGCGDSDSSTQTANEPATQETAAPSMENTLVGAVKDAEAVAGKMTEAGEAAANAMAAKAKEAMEYPLKVCLVSGEELGSMGAPVELSHEGTTVKFCCKNCIPEFQKDPQKYLTKLTEAAAK